MELLIVIDNRCNGAYYIILFSQDRMHAGATTVVSAISGNTAIAPLLVRNKVYLVLA
jgi:hypothetical protein